MSARVVVGSGAIAAGVAVVLAGAALPWLTLDGGRQVVGGVWGDGAYVATAAIGTAALWTAYLLDGRPGPLRTLAAGAAFLIVYWTAFDVERIVAVVSDGPLARAMGAPLMGPGPLVAGLGGVLLLGATFSVPATAGRLRRAGWLRLLLAAALLTAGAVHLQQAPERLEASAPAGLGLLAAAAALLGLGAAVVVRGHRLLYAGAAAACALLLLVSAAELVRGQQATLSAAIGALGEAVAILVAVPAALRR